MFTHMVFFWLQDGTDPAVAGQLRDGCLELLGDIPGVRHIWAGPPAMTPREVVDNSYAVGLCVVLDDAAAHDVYQTHPLHLEFIKRFKPHWKRVQVYDFQ